MIAAARDPLRLCAMLASVIAPAAFARADTYTITLDESLVGTPPIAGRVVVFFISDAAADLAGSRPLDGPFFENPQPIASMAVASLASGESITLHASNCVSFPNSIDSLEGLFRIQAILDGDDTERSMLEGPGNLWSEEFVARLSAGTDDRVSIRLTNVVPNRTLPRPGPNLRWVEFRSESLSAFAGRDVFHRAGVALPRGYFDPDRAGKRWPTVYIVPGFGGREESAANYAEMLRIVDERDAPQAVFVVLDPESPLGHHGFVDNENHGPRGSALVNEFIPHLEREFRLDPRTERRLLHGHSSGGWTVLWLQLNWPDFFGGCWALAPDPIDFTAFQYSNLYEDDNLFEFAPGTGNETPSYREVDFEGRDVVSMTVREENGMEFAIDPTGRSGQQWDAWEAMFSPRGDEGAPTPLFDARTGAINRDVANHWRRFDINMLVREQRSRLDAVVQSKVRLLCGEFDNFYLDRAVRRFKEAVELRAGDAWTGPGYVEIVRFAAHDSIVALAAERIHREMIEHLNQSRDD
jgi:hypothetical protein